MDITSLDEKIANQQKVLKDALDLFSKGAISKEKYEYQQHRLNDLYEQKDILNDIEEKPEQSFFMFKFLSLVGIILFLGSFHFLIGSGVNGLMLSKRVNFGYSEIIIDTDMIISMNPSKAKREYPLSYDICLKEDFF